MTRIATVISITIIVLNRLASGMRCKTNNVVSVAQLYPTLCSPMDCSLPGPSVHGILQARILKWVAYSLLQGITLTQELNSGFLHSRHSLPSEPPRKPDVKQGEIQIFKRRYPSVEAKRGQHIEHVIYQGRNKHIKINLICKITGQYFSSVKLAKMLEKMITVVEKCLVCVKSCIHSY